MIVAVDYSDGPVVTLTPETDADRVAVRVISDAVRGGGFSVERRVWLGGGGSDVTEISVYSSALSGVSRSGNQEPPNRFPEPIDSNGDSET